MKVLQVNKLYAPTIGGIETIVRDIAEGLNGQTEMQVLVCQPKGKHQKELLSGVKVIRANSFGTALSMPLSIDFFRQYRKLSKEVDIVQLHFPFPLADLATWLFDCKGKLVIWWHSDIVRQKFFLKLLSPLIHRTLQRADSIIVAANETLQSSKFLPKYIDKCKIIPFGLNFEDYELPNSTTENFLANKLNNSNNKKLLFVGRLVYYKGIDILLKAMKGINNAELFIVGTGTLEEQLKAEAKHLSITKNVHFLGNLSKVELLSSYKDCDFLIFPSCANSEAFGLTQLEAMYYGKPVINTNLPTAVPWVSVHKKTGLTVPVADVCALNKAIHLLVNDNSLREELGKNAAIRVRELFDRKSMMNNLHTHYRQILEA